MQLHYSTLFLKSQYLSVFLWIIIYPPFSVFYTFFHIFAKIKRLDYRAVLKTIHFFRSFVALSMNNLGIFKVCNNYFGDVNLGLLLYQVFLNLLDCHNTKTPHLQFLLTLPAIEFPYQLQGENVLFSIRITPEGTSKDSIPQAQNAYSPI